MNSSYRPSWIGIALLGLISRMPVPYCARLGRFVGSVFYLLDRKRRRFARINLELCFPELDAAARKQLLKQHFRALGQSLLSTIAITWHDAKWRLPRWVVLRQRDIFDQARAQGKNIILLAPHFVGLELAWARLSFSQQLVGMYREPRHNILHWAIDRYRRQFGGVPVETHDGMRPLVRLMRQGMPFYYLPDLDPGKWGAYVFAPFFQQQTATTTALSRLAKLTNAVVIPCIARQLEPEQGYEVIFQQPLTDFPSQDVDADAAKMNAVIEAEVRTMPEQYFWIHRRFKTRPPGAPLLYQKK